MSDLVRLSMSIEQPLADRLEKLVQSSGYTNRSEYLRDMIRERIVELEWAADQQVVGTLTLVYDHHQRGLTEKLMQTQHDHHSAVLATTHVHLTHDLCAEMILIKGKASHIRTMADGLRQLKGVLHAELSMASTGKKLK